MAERSELKLNTKTIKPTHSLEATSQRKRREPKRTQSLPVYNSTGEVVEDWVNNHMEGEFNIGEIRQQDEWDNRLTKELKNGEGNS